MTMQRQKEILTQIMQLVTEMAEDTPDAPVTAEPEPQKVEMLTIKECAEVTRLSVNTIRQLVTQGKIPHIRAGVGKRGKYLINKDDLIKLLYQIK